MQSETSLDSGSADLDDDYVCVANRHLVTLVTRMTAFLQTRQTG